MADKFINSNNTNATINFVAKLFPLPDDPTDDQITEVLQFRLTVLTYALIGLVVGNDISKGDFLSMMSLHYDEVCRIADDGDMAQYDHDVTPDLSRLDA